MGSWTTGWDIALNPPIGTVSSPVQGTLAEWGSYAFNAKSPSNPNGAAVGDGATDDNPSAGGGHIDGVVTAAAGGCAEFPGPATYLFSKRIFTTAASTMLRGSSRNGTVLKQKNSQNQPWLLTTDADGVEFRDLTVDGNKANNSSPGRTIALVNVNNCSAFNVRALNAPSDAIIVQATTGSSVLASHSETPGGDGIHLEGTCDLIRLIGNRIDTPTGNGIILIGNSNETNVVILGHTIKNSGTIGIATGTGNNLLAVVANAVKGSTGNAIDTGSCTDVAVAANVISGGNAIGINPDTGQRNAIVANVIRTNGGIAIYNSNTGQGSLSGRDFAVVGNIISGAALSGSQGSFDLDGSSYLALVGNLAKNGGTGIGYSIHKNNNTNPNRILLLGNIGYDDQTVKTQTYGLQVGAGTWQVSAAHNAFAGSLTGAINDNGPDTYTHGNFGYNPRGRLAPPAIPASTVIFQNPFNVDCTVYIAGGTLTAIGVGGLPVSANWGAQPTTTTASTGGTLAGSATYYYRCAARNPAGHTVECVEFSQVVPGGTGTNIVTIALPTGTGLRGVTGWDIYGRSTGAELLMATNWQRPTFIDDGSLTPSGAMPGTDTTGNTAITGITAAAPAGAVHTVRVLYGQSIKITYSVVPTSWDWWGD